MRSHKRFASCIIISALAASCADSPPPDPELNLKYQPLVTHQTKDLTMDCADLKNEVSATEQAMRVLDKQIASHQQQSQSSTMMSAVFGALGTMAPTAANANLDQAGSIISSANAGVESGQSMNTGQLKANYTQRHDALVQIYFARKCGQITAS
jgi:hypothetical protein